MARHYNPRDFLRRAPSHLLREYFLRKGVLAEIDWEAHKQSDVEPVLAALVSLPRDLQDDISRDFQDLTARTNDGGFVKAILSEARFHGIDPDLSDRFNAMRSHLERAFWILLHRKDMYWDGANVIWRVDKLPPGQWQKRGGLPQRPGPVDEGVVEDLRQSLIEYFSKNEARGRNCKIEAYRREDDEIFYAYPEDYKRTVSEYIGDTLKLRTMQPTFEIIFVHNDRRRTLDIHIEGDAGTANKLQVIFAKSVLREEIDEDYEEHPPVYVLQPLLSRSFQFRWPDEVGIEQVALKAMRIVVDGEPWQRVTVEADAADPAAIYDLLERVIMRLHKRRLRLDQIILSVTFKRRPHERRTPRRTIIATAPHTCRMINDERGQMVHRMLIQSGIERQEASDATDVSA
jgi:hypothetical protein